ncbi:hypothetical protein DFR68_105407 [Nocardia mexicana]|uniref:Uncharacterized protein n=1 Tax=Nocardia mexicana TaxID=279262 RepID=A0A370H418_9NOCA|nr:hypothetical protein DFR68_105407 [Nocardia mexicana]
MKYTKCAAAAAESVLPAVTDVSAPTDAGAVHSSGQGS